MALLSEWVREIKRANLPDGRIPDALRNVRGIIVDSFGKLSSLYRYADIAYIGGGFGAGIHNLNEAAVYGMPVIFGPNHLKFKEAADLIDCGGGFSIAAKEEFNDTIDIFNSSPSALAQAGKAAGDYIKRNLGATDTIYADLFPDSPAESAPDEAEKSSQTPSESTPK